MRKTHIRGFFSLNTCMISLNCLQGFLSHEPLVPAHFMLLAALKVRTFSMPPELYLFLVPDTLDVSHYSGTEIIPYASEK